MLDVLITTLLLTLTTGPIHRCGLELTPRPRPQVAKSGVALARQAASPSSYQTEHFQFFWSSEKPHAITGAAASIASGDSVPRLIRVASQAMEKAWKVYVDTMGYLPPKPLSTSYGWGLPVASGKLPVEFGEVASLSGWGEPGSFLYGVSGREAGGETGIVLAANLTQASNWGFVRDLDGKSQGSDYQTAWISPIQATASHEFFHSIQYRYDYRVEESILFEASAVAMERIVYPDETDYLAFLGKSETARDSGLSNLESHVSLFGGGGTYEHGWFVTQLMQDRGPEILRKLWEFNKGTKTSFRKSLISVLRSNGWSLDSAILHYALRLGRTGKRSTWSIPSLPGFTDAGMFPRLRGTLDPTVRPNPVLGTGRIQEWIDTGSSQAERLVVWIPDPGVSMGRSFSTPTGAGWEVCRGSVRLRGRDGARNVWSFGNAGPGENLPGASATSATLRLEVRTPADSLVTELGMPFSWREASGVQLRGKARVAGVSTPLAHVDLWKPNPAIEDWAARSVGSSGHAVVLEDGDRRLQVADAVLKLPFAPEKIYTSRGDGTWSPIGFQNVGSGVEIALGELDLATPIRFLASTEGEQRSRALEVMGNPSTGGKPIRFPLDGANDAAVLQILAQDGSCVRRIRAQWGNANILWDLKNEAGQRVRPGVYWYVWENVIGARRGTLLVGE